MKDYTHISFEERKEIYFALNAGIEVSEIANRLGRHRSAIYREIRRNTVGGKYVGSTAHEKTQKRQRFSRKNKIRDNPKSQAYIVRKLKEGWSPEQISGRLKKTRQDFYVCHESIYRYVYGEKDKDLYKCLRYKQPRRRMRYSRNKLVRFSGGKSIHARTKEAKVGKKIGHWEADTIAFCGARQKSVTTLVELKTLYIYLIKNETKYSEEVMAKIRDFIASTPRKYWETMTFDQGAEFADFRQIERWGRCMVYYCDSHSPWQRGCNENTNGRLRRYLPRNTDIENLTEEEIMITCKKMNKTPRKKLGYLTPKEALVLESRNYCRT